MTTESELIYINECASMLGTTVDGLRGYIRRRNWDAVPKPFKRGALNAWRRQDVIAWVDEKACETRRRRGRAA